MGNICNILSIICKTPLTLKEEDYYNYYNNNNKNKNNIPTLDISNNVILNVEDDEPPSYREVRNEESIYNKKTMLFNGFSDTLIMHPRI